LAISGALRKGSTNTALLRALLPLAPSDMTIEIVTLHGIPLYDGDVEVASGKPQSVLELDARIRAADGLIICSPEYNFSMPGVLKNAIDWLSRQSQPFGFKRIGVMGVSSGNVGTARMQYHLRQSLQALNGLVMPRPEVFVTRSAEKFDAEGNLTDEETRKLLVKWLAAYHDWVEKKR
jgi:chromate reductase